MSSSSPFREEDCEIVHEQRNRGGQHVGTPSDVTVRHRPTGIAATCSEHRSQFRNKLGAMLMVRHLVGLAATHQPASPPESAVSE